jgi:hypothetical protein
MKRLKMLDREVVKEFLQEELEEVEVPKDISFDKLVETFCKYTEDDYYEWLENNYKSFFQSLSQNNPDWDWIKGRIEHYSKENLNVGAGFKPAPTGNDRKGGF